MEGYGLKGGSTRPVDGRDIGPCKELIQKKRDEARNERLRNQQIGRSRKRYTEEERAAALRQMQDDAEKREDRKGQQASHKETHAEEEESAKKRGGATFLKDVTTSAHGITSDNSGSLASRVAQNRHTNQRLHDSSFL